MLARAVLTIVIKLKSACYRFHAKQTWFRKEIMFLTIISILCCLIILILNSFCNFYIFVLDIHLLSLWFPDILLLSPLILNNTYFPFLLFLPIPSLLSHLWFLLNNWPGCCYFFFYWSWHLKNCSRILGNDLYTKVNSRECWWNY